MQDCIPQEYSSTTLKIGWWVQFWESIILMNSYKKIRKSLPNSKSSDRIKIIVNWWGMIPHWVYRALLHTKFINSRSISQILELKVPKFHIIRTQIPCGKLLPKQARGPSWRISRSKMFPRWIILQPSTLTTLIFKQRGSWCSNRNPSH